MQKEINNALNILKQGKVLLYPADTIWGIGCDATNYEAVQKIYDIKQRDDSKALICLVSDFKMLNQYIEDIPEVAYDILKHTKKPTTIIYDNPKWVAENLIADDNTIGIRVVRDGFCNALIKRFKKPIVSTSANISGTPSPTCFKEIDDEILKGVDYIVDLQREKKSGKPSSIIKLSSDGIVKIIRK